MTLVANLAHRASTLQPDLVYFVHLLKISTQRVEMFKLKNQFKIFTPRGEYFSHKKITTGYPLFVAASRHWKIKALRLSQSLLRHRSVTTILYIFQTACAHEFALTIPTRDNSHFPFGPLPALTNLFACRQLVEHILQAPAFCIYNS